MSGEWLARVEDAGRKRVTLAVTRHLRPREEVPDLWLVFAPVKRAPLDWMVEKATELGVGRLVPVVTQRTVVDRVNLDRLRAIAIEAAEQCDRTALPALDEPVKLERLLKDWPANRALLFADEEGGVPLQQVAEPGPAAILIGPEGGFTAEERELIRALPSAQAVALGPRILRAETAALAALSLWMAAAGDWNRPPRA
ncbi:MAG TPA: 16S rRNA (uracil(1498)-N(3))-methyltransferase [Allosphingosinicella sp.]